jgi:predicted RNA polymerase sigma factor
VSTATGVEDLLRELAPQVVGILVRRFGDFGSCEEAVQEALLAASVQWPAEGVPDNPKGWLITVASRRRTQLWRSDTARRRREQTAAAAWCWPSGSRCPASAEAVRADLVQHGKDHSVAICHDGREPTPLNAGPGLECRPGPAPSRMLKFGPTGG